MADDQEFASEVVEAVADTLHSNVALEPWEEGLDFRRRAQLRSERAKALALAALRTLRGLGVLAGPGEVVVHVEQIADEQSEVEQERDELFNRLGRVTSELGLSMDCTAGRIIEAIDERVDDEREACASVSVRVEVPGGAEAWTPLEAWEEALVAMDEAFREAIRNRAAAPRAGTGDDA